MSWQRFNTTTNVFEVSENNGASWTTLVIAPAGITSAPLPSNIAYKDQANIFTQDQRIDKARGAIEFKHVSGPGLGRISSLYNEGEIRITANCMWNGASWNRDNTALAACALELYPTGTGGMTYVGCGAGANPASLVEVFRVDNVGVLTTKSNIEAGGNIHNRGGYIFPGDSTASGAKQSSTSLAYHPSYGLYTLGGLYVGWHVWTNNVYCADVSSSANISGAAVYSANGYFEYGRSAKLGSWTDFTPQLFNHGSQAVPVTTVYTWRYMLIGKTCFLSLYITVNNPISTNVNFFYLPAGLVSANNTCSVGLQDNGTGGTLFLNTGPGSAIVNIYRAGLTNYAAGSVSYMGTAAIPIQ